jgi:hypothetical protein
MNDENEVKVKEVVEDQATNDASTLTSATPTSPVKESKKEESVEQKVHNAFEEFREYLVHLLGDIPGVHNTVNDAKASIAPHVPAPTKE